MDKILHFNINLSKKLLLLICLTLINFNAFAQTTKVKGRVTDAKTGEGIPFVGIFFKGTTIGVSTDLDGYYTLEKRGLKTKTLCALILGYDPQETEIKLKSFNKVDFKLYQTHNMLTAATVKPDNRYMKWLLKQINKNRDRNNPETNTSYKCKIYNKIEIDLTNPRKNLNNNIFNKNFGFVYDYIDTSVVSGQPYLPVMISETVSKKFHVLHPEEDKEIIIANQISGLNSGNAISHLTGSLLLKTNFYNNFINSFKVEIPSPISSTGELYYNYYLIDSLKINNRKTYMIRFHPKKFTSTASFDGEMHIDAKDFALVDIHAKLQKGANVNWIRDLVIDVENQRIGDSIWFYKHDKMYVDFSVQLKDSSKLASFLGNRDMVYSDPVFGTPNKEEMGSTDYNIVMQKGATLKPQSYWDNVRPYQLSTKEKNIYRMVDEIKSVPLYKNVYSLMVTLITGYYEMGKISFGPYGNIMSYNNLEGNRFQLGIRTTKEYSRKYRISTYLAYGTKDKQWKGGARFEYMFNNMPTRKLTISGKRDVVQLGRGPKAFSETNILSSVLAKNNGGGSKKSPVDELSIQYEHEITSNFSNIISLETRKIHSNLFVPMFRPDSSRVSSIASNWLRYTMRFSWHEPVTRGVFEKQYIYTKYPVLIFDFLGSVKGLWKNDFSYLKTEMTILYNLNLPPLGTSLIKINAGKIFGRVPYPLLKLHAGNMTYFLDKTAFSCMSYYEFASDEWVTLFYEHNFKGFFLGKIPLIRKLNLREVYTLKVAYGNISKKNNGIFGSPESKNAVLLFPFGMSALNTPYVETGFGITNILRIFRIDANWRLTHKYHTINGKEEKVPNLFSINFGMEFKF